MRHRVVLLRSTAGVPVDLALGAMPFEKHAVDRAGGFEIGQGVVIATCSAEDLIVFKAYASREKDWLDIEGIAIRQAGRLDERLLWSELLPLLELKGAPEDAHRLRMVLDRART